MVTARQVLYFSNNFALDFNWASTRLLHLTTFRLQPASVGSQVRRKVGRLTVLKRREYECMVFKDSIDYVRSPEYLAVLFIDTLKAQA